ncbi:hypothetical protein [Mycoplasmopsis synoviae]|uniref:hypothetical protein n=1 Tax=Mycoplasmopsis synoviae TaxID=2109 RepID=UPI0035628AB2
MKTKKLNLLKVAAFGVLPVASGVALVSATSSVNSTNARSNNFGSSGEDFENRVDFTFKDDRWGVGSFNYTGNINALIMMQNVLNTIV